MNTYKYEYKSDPVRAGETLTHDVKGPCLAAFSVFQRFASYEKYPQQSGKYSHLSNKRRVTPIDFEKKNPPSTVIELLYFFHPPLLVYSSYVLVFSKKSHPPRLF